MDKYEKVEKPREETTIKENEIRITTKGKMRNSISYATTLFREKGFSEVVLKAMGRAINKTVAIAEILKRRIPDLHQITEISSTDITDVYEPLEEGLDRIETTRHVSSITIVLSTTPLDTTAPGYQPPLPADQVKEPVAADEGSPGQAPRNARRAGPGRGRGGRGRGRGGRRGGFTGAQGAVQDGGQAEYDEAAPPASERRERAPKGQGAQGSVQPQAQTGHGSPTQQGEEGRPPRRGRGGRRGRGRGGYNNRGGDYNQADDFEQGESVNQGGYNQNRNQGYNQGGNQQGYSQPRQYSQGRNRNYNQGENYSQGDNYNQRGNFYAQEGGQQGGDYNDQQQQGGEGAPSGRGLRGGFRGRGGRRGGPRGAPRGARRGGRGGSEGASSPQPVSE